MNRLTFIQAYREACIAHYPWARDTARLDRFMDSVVATLNGANTWHADGPALQDAAKACSVKPTLRALRALPEHVA